MRLLLLLLLQLLPLESLACRPRGKLRSDFFQTGFLFGSQSIPGLFVCQALPFGPYVFRKNTFPDQGYHEEDEDEDEKPVPN
ncbi:hypothetical protein [Burkholderia ubonensis]|uniref:hypothetical protein n=1 Tax=Burkholderia ubonensis TaxID=101571 RepID=UPI0012FB1DC8|nr:hypothetical protein [Burkholderia ubonensis]